MVTVSVIITTYNRPQMLTEAVASVLEQTYQDFELLIMDDNSTMPEQAELLSTYWGDDRIRIYKDDVKEADRRKTTRYATLANIGIKLARGKYITYLCDDDLYLPARLELMSERLDRGDCQVVYGTQRLMQDGAVTGHRPAIHVLSDAWHLVDHSSVMHTKVVAEAVGGWNDNPECWSCGDAWFWRRLTTAGYDFYPVSDETDIHRFWSGSVSSGG